MKRVVKLIGLAVLLFAFANSAYAQTPEKKSALTNGDPLQSADILAVSRPIGSGAFVDRAVTGAGINALSGRGPNVFDVTAYGAKCDGTILYFDVHTTNGSAVISSPDYNFTAADVGKQINLGWIANYDIGTQPSHIFVGTITGISGVSAILNAPVGFTSTAFQWASARFYMTDDSTSIQNALNANGANLQPGYVSPIIGGNFMNEMNGGLIQFPAGVCVAKNLTFFSGQRIEGAALGATNLMLPNGANGDIMDSANFANCTGQSFPSGVQNTTIENISFDGNKLTNTGTNAGLQGLGTGDGIRWCGAAMKIHNVAVNMFAADGLEVEGWNNAGSPGQTGNGMESYYDTITAFYNTGNGFVYNGPTDSYINNFIAAYNVGGGLILGSSNNTMGGNVHYVSNSHTYSNGTFGFLVNLPFTNFMNDEAEANIGGTPGFICNFTCFLTNTGTATMTTGSGAALYLTNNSSISTVTIGNSSAKNFIFDSTIGAVASGSLNVAGSIIKNVQAGALSQFSWATGSAVGGPFQVINSGGNIALHIDDTGGVGIGTATPASGTKFDVRALEAVNGVISNGTTFTIASGCGTPGSLTGGATVGSFTAGQTACAPVITLPTAPHGWICHIKDLTTPADTFTQSATSATSCTSSATVTNGDTILFDAIGF